MLTLFSKVLCCCAGGRVRSVAAKYILEDAYGMQNVLAAGLEKTSPETLAMLCGWADVVLVVGERKLRGLVPAEVETVHLNVGPDTYHHYKHPELQQALRFLIAGLFE